MTQRPFDTASHPLEEAERIALARRCLACGWLAAASHVLEPLRDGPAVALDLRARISAHEGRYADAAACWRRLLALDPANEPARQAMLLAERYQSGQHRPRERLVLYGRALMVITITAGLVPVLALERATAHLGRVLELGLTHVDRVALRVIDRMTEYLLRS